MARFDFMDASVYKKYQSMSNVIVRISDGTDAGKVRDSNVETEMLGLTVILASLF